MMAFIKFLTSNIWRTIALALVVTLGVSYVQTTFYKNELADLKLKVADATAKAEKEARIQAANQQAAHDVALAKERALRDAANARAQTLLAQLEKIDDYNAKLAASLRVYLVGMYDADRQFAAKLH